MRIELPLRAGVFYVAGIAVGDGLAERVDVRLVERTGVLYRVALADDNGIGERER